MIATEQDDVCPGCRGRQPVLDRQISVSADVYVKRLQRFVGENSRECGERVSPRSRLGFAGAASLILEISDQSIQVVVDSLAERLDVEEHREVLPRAELSSQTPEADSSGFSQSRPSR